MVKARAPSSIQNIPLGDTGLRRTHGVTIAAFQHADAPWDNADNRTVLEAGNTIVDSSALYTACICDLIDPIGLSQPAPGRASRGSRSGRGRT